jgi:hypothetical protein
VIDGGVTITGNDAKGVLQAVSHAAQRPQLALPAIFSRPLARSREHSRASFPESEMEDPYFLVLQAQR